MNAYRICISNQKIYLEIRSLVTPVSIASSNSVLYMKVKFSLNITKTISWTQGKVCL